MLQEAHVAVTPGEAFLAPRYFRLSYAASTADLEEAIRRIRQYIAK